MSERSVRCGRCGVRVDKIGTGLWLHPGLVVCRLRGEWLGPSAVTGIETSPPAPRDLFEANVF
jgi:hypothetical protein